MKLNKNKIVDNFLIFFIISSSGMPSIISLNTYIFLFLFSLYIFIIKKKQFDKVFVLSMFFLIFLFTIQTYIFSFVSIVTIVGLFIRIFIAYFILKIVGLNFIQIYIKQIYFIAIISFLFYIILNLSQAQGITSFLINHFTLYEFHYGYLDSSIKYNIMGIYTYIPELIYRNSGPFWEPGAFSGYLLIAFIFNFYLFDKYQKRRATILVLAILSTLSTTGFIALFTFLFFTYYKIVKNILLKIMALVIIISSGYYGFVNFDFLGAKIESQLSDIQGADVYGTDTNSQRFLNILRDIQDIKGHELFGRGVNPYTRYSHDPENQIRTVGLTDIMVKFGIPFFLFMIYLLYRSICSYLKFQNQQGYFQCIGILITILIILMSEVYFNFPMFWSLLFLQIVYKKATNTKQLRIN